MTALNGSAILSIIQEICSFGSRWMGSRGEERTRNYILDRFRAAGLATELQSFPYLSYAPQTAALSVAGRETLCQPIALSSSTQEPLTAPLVFAGQCSEQELAELESGGIKVKDSILVTTNMRSFVAYPPAQDWGARGLVCVTDLEGNTIRCGCARLDREAGKIPAVAIGGDDGRWIQTQLHSGKAIEATLESRGLIQEALGYNVVGRKTGTSKRKILVTAHYDSFWNGVHAMDNASGTAVVIALSQALALLPEVSLEFVAFGGEELGLWGSSSYLEKAAKRLDEILAMVNLDTFGSNRSKLEIGVTADLVGLCEDVAEAVGVSIDCWNIPPRAASDQNPFVQQGVSAVWLVNCGNDKRYHTPLDTPDQMDSEKLGIVAALTEELIKQLGAGCFQ
ncbi:M28 family metallopeptidase [Desulfoferrobacter suflitae]|uniref:M28 family metallopeptidase n=1 Tax=Desulfoferrobacter suflitae TaxID=2865782 RepID=UPI002164C6BD|nr:M28 family metallopeptidase [Desulfoferrobacter suflitae]MCK8602513.1 M28 family metallopeptidase [Desulfoferrobacter suflitae]